MSRPILTPLGLEFLNPGSNPLASNYFIGVTLTIVKNYLDSTNEDINIQANLEEVYRTETKKKETSDDVKMSIRRTVAYLFRLQFIEPS